MADIAGIVLAALQITAQVASLSYDYINGCKQAPADIKKLVDELRSLYNVLISLQELINQNPQSATLQQLNAGGGPLFKCNVELSEVRLKLERVRGSKGGRLKWPLNQKETSECFLRIERHKSLFILALSLEQSSTSATIKSSVDEIKTDTNVILKDLRTESDAQRDERQKAENSRIAVEKGLEGIKDDIQNESGAQRDQRQKEEARRQEEDARRNTEDAVRRKKETDEKRVQVLDWIFHEDFDKRHSEISRRRQEDTGGWLLEAAGFKSWFKNPDTPLLWGYGIPGAGKTFLSSAVIDHFKGKARAEKYGVAYIYFDYNEEAKQSPIWVLTSLAKQLSSQLPEIPKELEEEYDKQARNLGGKPTFEFTYSALVAISKLFTRTIIICDALDECNLANRQRELLPLFHRMGRNGIKLFLTSRQHPEDIQVSLHDSAKIELCAMNEDIKRYVQQKITENPRINGLLKRAGCENRIIPDLISCAKGMFLLVHFHVRYLCQQTNPNQILVALDKLQSSATTEEGLLDPTYDRVMTSIRSQYKSGAELALNVLSWLVKARRTLKVEELQVALSIEEGQHELDDRNLVDRTTLLEVCAGLVAIDNHRNGDTIRLAHYTVQEYLLNKSLLPNDADFKIATACCNFLLLDIYAKHPDPKSHGNMRAHKEDDFLGYAGNHLLVHLQDCDEALTIDLVLQFIASPGSIYSYYWASYRYDDIDIMLKEIIDAIPCLDVDCPSLSNISLQFACILGHYRVVRLMLEGGDGDQSEALFRARAKRHDRVVTLLQNKVDISNSAITGQTPLHLAALWGREDMAQLFLKNSADISATDKDGRTALHLAVGQGSKDMAQLLLENGADTSATGKDGRTALHLALSCEDSEDMGAVIQLLLENGADTSATDKDGRTALHLAVGRGFKDMAQLLLENGADTSATDKDGRTALHLAVGRGSKDMAQLLLKNGADTSATDKDGWAALHLAVGWGSKDMAQLLLENGADTSATGKDGRTALHLALSCEDSEDMGAVIQLLLENGADLSATDKDGRTALHLALSCEFSEDMEAVIQLLLENGANLSATDKDGRTALHLAVGRGSKDMAQLLLKNDVDISAIDKDGWTALHLAARQESKDMAQLLLKNGADTSATDKDGRTALHLAVVWGSKDMAQLLLENGADTSATDKDGRTALHLALSCGYLKYIEAVIQLLLENGANLSATDKDGQTALHLAVVWGSKDMAQLLLKNGADTSATGKDGRTALHLAAERGSKDMAQLLLENGADTSATDKDGRTALHLAVVWGSKDMAQLLLENGADTSATDKDGRTALHLAVVWGSKDMTQLLLENGADTSAADKDGRTALHLAARRGSKDMAQLLLKNGADTSATDKDGWTALHLAFRKHHKELIWLLLENGADVSVTSHLAKKALHAAASTGDTKLVKLLLDKDTDASAVDNSGVTVLHTAASKGDAELAKLLLQQGADTSAVNTNGETALYCAASAGHKEVVQLLLEKGASIWITDNCGKTPLNIATSGGHIEVCELLQNSAGEKPRRLKRQYPLRPKRTSNTKGSRRL